MPGRLIDEELVGGRLHVGRGFLFDFCASAQRLRHIVRAGTEFLPRSQRCNRHLARLQLDLRAIGVTGCRDDLFTGNKVAAVDDRSKSILRDERGYCEKSAGRGVWRRSWLCTFEGLHAYREGNACEILMSLTARAPTPVAASAELWNAAQNRSC